MSRHLPTFTSHFVNLWSTIRNVLNLMTSCTKNKETHIGFKAKYNKKEILHSLTPQEEENSTLVMVSEE